MQTIGDLFNILLFVTMVGGAFTLLFLLLGKVPRLPLPLWFGICCMTSYIVPVTAGGTWLIPPEEHGWVEGYDTLCGIWAGGMILLLLLRGLRSLLGYRAFRGCRPCEDRRILGCSDSCARLAGLRRAPGIFWGELKTSACVLGVLRPAVILSRTIAEQLTERELTAVLCHEAIHVRRGHLALGIICDYICIVNWFNPLVWLMRRELSALCELDCDRHATRALAGRISSPEYAHALLRLLTLSRDCDASPMRSAGALGFPGVKRRIRQIVSGRKRLLRLAGAAAGILGLLLAVLFSLHMSRSYFYPYLPDQPEYAVTACIFLSSKTTFVVKGGSYVYD